MATRRFLLLALALVPLAWIGGTAAAESCEPYPVGRCGDYDREAVIFCYQLHAGEMRDATVPATRIGAGNAWLYVREEPTAAFVADPWEADLPFRSLYRETNAVPGLQTERVTCATFEWWAECDSWMGPYNAFAVGPDAQVL